MSNLLGDVLRDRQAVIAMCESAGWKVLCEEHRKRLDELTATLLDPKTPAEDAEVLRQTRAKVVEQFGAPTLIANLLTKLDLIAERESARQKAQAQSDQPPSP